MRVQYPEGPRSLTIAAIGITAQRGEPVEVPDDVGEQLLRQGWQKAGTTTKNSKKETR